MKGDGQKTRHHMNPLIYDIVIMRLYIKRRCTLTMIFICAMKSKWLYFIYTPSVFKNGVNNSIHKQYA